ncbi:MAG: pncB, partial [Chlamydiia bacterium]|nr:pncB [Chlamydiia bacterium]
DFYQLSMAFGYWKTKLHEKEAVFHLFFRRPPFQGGFTIAAGLESLIEFIKNYHFDASDIAYLTALTNPTGAPYFERDFLEMLASLRLEVSIDAVPEGTVVFPYEPLVRVRGPLMQCQLLESSLLNLINFPTLIATKAARICLAAQGDAVLEFGMRRAQGVDGALTASRAAYIGGCSATSNVLAGKMYGIPLQGTQAHSWVMAFDDEEESFREYAKILPDVCSFLVDTYDTIEGVKKAIRVGKWLKKQGKKLLGVRLDSGDLAELSIESRRLLDEAGLQETQIVASNELDETLISELKRQGAKISIWGVGTSLVTGKGQPALDGVYKLAALKDSANNWKYVLKLSEQFAKVSNPGLQQVRRYSKNGQSIADVIYDTELGISKVPLSVDLFDATRQESIDTDWDYRDLLVPIFKQGVSVYVSPSLQEIKATTQRELAEFPVGIKRFLNPHLYPVGMEKTLYDIKVELIKKIRKQKHKI